jgi:cytochrome c peroxidase
MSFGSGRRRFIPVALAALAISPAGCADQADSAISAPDANTASARTSSELIDAVRELAAAKGVSALEAPPKVRPALVRLGESLAFDKILSGNHDISCMTCHMPEAGTGDGRSLSIGSGGLGLGGTRTHPDGDFIPRNAPTMFNLGALNSLFLDGRVSVDAGGAFHTPAGNDLTPDMTRVFEFGPASALGLFPVLSPEEMRGHSGNELAQISNDDPREIWSGLMARLGEIPEYRRLFELAYPGTRFEDMTFAYASNAIGGFMIDRFSYANTPWDRFLSGQKNAMSQAQLEGARTFLSLRCVSCHSGAAFTDNQFHNVAVPQFGPGRGDGLDGKDDFGRGNVTGLATDRYAFRTSPLRNIEISGPYGHDGAFYDLRGFIAHYSDSDISLQNFAMPGQEPLLQTTLLPNFVDILATRDTLLNGVVLTPEIVDQLMSFMSALTDPAVKHLELTIPKRVPSGLPVDRF